MIQVIGLVVTIVAAIFVYYRMVKSKEKPVTVQDVIGRKAIVKKSGIVRNGNVFRVVVELSQINMQTNSKREQDSVWVNFRIFLNTLGIPYTLLVQSKYMDIKDYSNWYSNEIQNNEFLTPELKEVGSDVVKHLNQIDEDKKTRDYRCFIIFHFDPLSDSIDSGVKTGAGFIDDFIDLLMKKNKNMTDEEMEDLAEQILNEAVQETFAMAEQLKMHYRKLDRAGIYDMIYAALQKELSSEVRLSDAVNSDSFTAHIESVTSRVLAMDYDERKGA